MDLEEDFQLNLFEESEQKAPSLRNIRNSKQARTIEPSPDGPTTGIITNNINKRKRTVSSSPPSSESLTGNEISVSNSGVSVNKRKAMSTGAATSEASTSVPKQPKVATLKKDKVIKSTAPRPARLRDPDEADDGELKLETPETDVLPSAATSTIAERTATTSVPKQQQQVLAEVEAATSVSLLSPPPPPASSKEKRRRVELTAEEDPLQHHSRPRELSRHAAALPAAATSSSEGAQLIFSRTPFSSLPLPPRLVSVLEKATSDGGLGLQTTTRVQSVVVPLLQGAGSNLLMKSQTGSGKTLAYLLPILSSLMSGEGGVSRGDGTLALVIAPTRELVMQITDTLAQLTKCCVWVVCGSILGGERRKSEKARLRKGVVILVATPGRLLDHAKSTDSFRLNRLRWVVLDEADRLLDMGFEQTVLEILSIVRGTRLPGLKDRHQQSSSATDAGSRDGHNKVRPLTTLDERWRAQAVAALKTCAHVDGLHHIMASATMTRGVRELALPVMGGSNFYFVDADGESVELITNAADLLTKTAASAGVKATASKSSSRGEVVNGVVCFADDDDDDAKTAPPPTTSAGATEGAGDDRKRRSTLEEGESMQAPVQLKQYHMLVSCKWRLSALVSFLRCYAHQKIVVFFSTCDSVDFHGLLFRGTQWPLELDAALDDKDASASSTAAAAAQKRKSKTASLDPLPTKFTGLFGAACHMYRLHGNVPQKVRQEVYRDFAAASSGVLLCTDVAARGLDLPRVDWILQYDPPCETTDYVHRIGRTARRGLGGSALMFLLPSEKMYISLLNSHALYPEALSLQSLFLDVAAHIPGAGKFKNTDEMAAVILQRRLETMVNENRHLLGASRQAFRSFVRAYATHSADTKGIFQVQSLHLGHAAKSFALRDSPTALRNYEDVIGRIFNGEFSTAVVAAETGGGAESAEGQQERIKRPFQRDSSVRKAERKVVASQQKRKQFYVAEHET